MLPDMQGVTEESRISLFTWFCLSREEKNNSLEAHSGSQKCLHLFFTRQCQTAAECEAFLTPSLPLSLCFLPPPCHLYSQVVPNGGSSAVQRSSEPKATAARKWERKQQDNEEEEKLQDTKLEETARGQNTKRDGHRQRERRGAQKMREAVCCMPQKHEHQTGSLQAQSNRCCTSRENQS